jgi:hypothetical protein
MSDLRTAAHRALEVLEQLQGGCTDSDDGTVEAITVWCPDVVSALRAALEQDAVERDALRYRWLKPRATSSTQQIGTPKGTAYSTAWHIVTGGSDTDIDAAIDAALKKDDSVTAPPIWETLAEIGESAPAGTWDALPAENCREGINDAASR